MRLGYDLRFLIAAKLDNIFCVFLLYLLFSYIRILLVYASFLHGKETEREPIQRSKRTFYGLILIVKAKEKQFTKFILTTGQG